MVVELGNALVSCSPGLSSMDRNVRLGQLPLDVRQAQATNNVPIPHEQKPHTCTLTINVSPCPVHTQWAPIQPHTQRRTHAPLPDSSGAASFNYLN